MTFNMMRDLVDPVIVACLARQIAETDAAQFARQYPAYGVAGETRKALEALRADPLHAERYTRFLADMVFGERVGFRKAMESVDELASPLLHFD